MGICFPFIIRCGGLQPWVLTILFEILDQALTVLGFCFWKTAGNIILEIDEVFNFLPALKERTSLQSYVCICMLDRHDVLRNLLFLSVVFHQSACVQV